MAFREDSAEELPYSYYLQCKYSSSRAWGIDRYHMEGTYAAC
jgi:hypothetical protein